MTRTASFGKSSARAIVSRKRCVACDADQIVALPSRTSATAHDGPIDACDCIGQ